MPDQKNTAVEDKSTPTLAMIGGGELSGLHSRFELKGGAIVDLCFSQVVWEADVSDSCGFS
jgi:hypothetical protein